VLKKKPESTFVGIMSEIRSWLDRRQIEPVSFKPVADAEKGVGFEIAFNSEDEANLFLHEFA
jgi:hypothetical protein